jgi:hypothetical protein
VVNAKPAPIAPRQKIKDQLVCRFEDFGNLHANSSQMIDIKEATVVDFFGSGAPVAESVHLRVEQSMQGVEAGRISRFTFECPHRTPNPLADMAVAFGQYAQAFLRGRLRCGTRFVSGEGRKLSGGCTQRFEGGRVQARRGALKNLRIRRRSNWQFRAGTGQEEGSTFERKLEAARLEDFSIAISEDGKENSVRKHCLGRAPIDIKIACVWRVSSILKDVHPPQI